MKYFLILCVFVVNFAIASDIESIVRANSNCNGEITATDEFVVVKNSKDSLRIYDYDQTVRTISSNEVIRSFDIFKHNLYVLTTEGLYQYDLNENKQSFSTNFFKQPGHMYDVKFVSGKAYIATHTNEILIFDLMNRNFAESIELEGKTESIANNDKYLFIYSSSTGIRFGAVYNSIYVIDIYTQSIVKETKLYSNPGGNLEVKGDSLFIGNEFQWQLKLDKIFEKDAITNFHSLFVPDTKLLDAPFRDDKNIYYCQKKSNTLKVVRRDTVERK